MNAPTPALGPWRDESGCRCVHRPVCRSLEALVRVLLGECLSGNGASGSIFARRIGLVTGVAAATIGLSTVFECWAAARPGLYTAFLIASLAVAAGFSVDMS